VSEAKDRARVIAGQVKRLFLTLKGKDRCGYMAELTGEQQNEIVRSIIKEHLECFEESMTQLKRLMSDQELGHKAYFYGSLGADKKEQHAKGDYRDAQDTADQIITKRGLNVEKGSSTYNLLRREILKAESMVLKALEDRVHGDYSTSGADLIAEYERQNQSEPEEPPELI